MPFLFFYWRIRVESLQNISMVFGSESLTRFHPDAPYKIIYKQIPLKTLS